MADEPFSIKETVKLKVKQTRFAKGKVDDGSASMMAPLLQIFFYFCYYFIISIYFFILYFYCLSAL